MTSGKKKNVVDKAVLHNQNMDESDFTNKRSEKKLSAKEIKDALRIGIPKQLSDGGGLYFSVIEKNKGVWFMRGRLKGTSKRRVLGHEDMTLAEARDLRDEERKALKSGIDTVAQKKEQWKKIEEDGRTFGMIAWEWVDFWKNDKDDKTIQSTVGRLNKHIIPKLAKLPYNSLTFEDLKNVCVEISEKGHREMANRVSTIINQICRFAKINGYHRYNIAEDLPTIFPKPKRDVNFEGLPAITDKIGVADMLVKIDKFINTGRCTPHMAAVLQLFPRVPLRASSMLLSEWKHIDFDNSEWIIPAENMKGEIGKRQNFIVPMSTQVKAILKVIYECRITDRYVFPSGGKSGHLTAEGVNKTMHKAGIPLGKMCVHGWRKVWGTLTREYGLPDKLVEKGLAHVSGSAVELAYNRAQYKEVMRYAFQWWSDVIDALKNHTPIPKISMGALMAYT